MFLLLLQHILLDGIWRWCKDSNDNKVSDDSTFYQITQAWPNYFHFLVSLPPGTLATTIQLAYSFAVIFTFPLQNYPSLEIVRRSVERFKGEKATHSQQQDSIISAMIVVLLSIIAVSKSCNLFSHDWIEIKNSEWLLMSTIQQQWMF